MGVVQRVTWKQDCDEVDLLNPIGDISFDQIWRNRNKVSVRGVTVPLISKEDLIENKRQVGRLRDRNDVDELLARPDVGPDPKKI